MEVGFAWCAAGSYGVDAAVACNRGDFWVYVGGVQAGDGVGVVAGAVCGVGRQVYAACAVGLEGYVCGGGVDDVGCRADVDGEAGIVGVSAAGSIGEREGGVALGCCGCGGDGVAAGVAVYVGQLGWFCGCGVAAGYGIRAVCCVAGEIDRSGVACAYPQSVGARNRRRCEDDAGCWRDSHCDAAVAGRSAAGRIRHGEAAGACARAWGYHEAAGVRGAGYGCEHGRHAGGVAAGDGVCAV